MTAGAHEEYPHHLKENIMKELPVRTPEQRAADLEKGVRARKQRAEVKRLLKQGTTTLPAVLAKAATDDAIAGIRVAALVQSMPGVGDVRAKQIMGRLGIAENRRVRGLGANQRAALEAEFAA
jgi:transposase